ncbi:MAG: hypothetical protein R2729_16805 [Bryobacteraceae bacterium]
MATCDLLLLLTAASAAQASYFAIPLGSLGGGNSYPYAVNSGGTVAGSSGDGSNVRGFLWNGGSMTPIGTFGGGNSFLHDVNDSGVAVGVAYHSSPLFEALVYSGGVAIGLGTLGGPESVAEGINNAGTAVVGYSRTQNGFVDFTSHAFLWNGLMFDLGTLSGSGISAAHAVNDALQIVGGSATSGSGTAPTHAVLWHNGSITDLGTLGGAHSVAYDINEAGLITGTAYNAANQARAFLWNGVMVDLGSLADESQGRAINDAGDVVGYSRIPSGETHAVLWQSGQIVDLNVALLNTLPGGAWLEIAEGINNSGLIVAHGSDGMGYLLTPAPGTPEPGSLVLCAVGFSAIWHRRARRRALS